MKRYKASDLSHNRAEVIKEAKANGVIIECRNTNGDVVDELILVKSERTVNIETSDGEYVFTQLWRVGGESNVKA